MIFREGDASDLVYLIESGEVNLLTKVPGHGQVSILTLKPGELMGLALGIKGKSLGIGKEVVAATPLASFTK